MRIFISYNRDELSSLNKIKDLSGYVNKYWALMPERLFWHKPNPNNGSQTAYVYFDELAEGPIKKEVEASMDSFLRISKDDKNANDSQIRAALLLVSDKQLFYGWTEKEIIKAMANDVPIFVVKVKKFFKYAKSGKDLSLLINKMRRKAFYPK